MIDHDRRLTVPDVLPLITRFAKAQGNEIGGSLHVVLDDYNVRDKDVQFCVEYAKENDDPLGVEVAETLLQMSRTQRLKIAGMYYDLQSK